MKTALKSPHWVTAMINELKALYRNRTWTPFPHQSHYNVVGSRRVFKTKLKADGSIVDRFKAQLVAKVKPLAQLLGIPLYGLFSRLLLADSSLFTLHCGTGTIYLLLHVNDIIITDSSTYLLHRLITKLSSEFSMKDLGELHYFLGIEVTKFSGGLFLSQQKYIKDILVKNSMSESKPVAAPLTIKHDLHQTTSVLADATQYRQMVGSLQYLIITRPDIAHAINLVSQFMHRPTIIHLQAIKRILRYLNDTLDYGIRLLANSTLNLYSFSNGYWDGCVHTRRSTTDYNIYFGANCISWCSNKQPTVSRSSTEAEHRSMASTTADITWITYLLRELEISLTKVPVLYCDNISALYLAKNPKFHIHTKHIELDYHFIREKVVAGSLVTRHVSTTSQLADVFTKPLPK
ncbi:uncharacterized protein LOC113294788 [Papaver somniferum]|uniref:uncharacterized protein LOC113294788 n=1 Tax=Papaver somniferum TaxID=3469 RepID=UPI000E6FF7BC|nr:uncharacterized protein LOC113294788 [Papaver somniferum]